MGKLFGKNKTQKRCVSDPESGQIVCKSTRINKDGSETELAGFNVRVDGGCNVNTDDMFETEEGELAELEKFAVHKIKNKCKNTPKDY